MTKLCECGCGEPTKIAKNDYRRLGHVKGEPLRFVNGHNARGSSRTVETREKMSAYASARPAEHREKLVASRRARPLGDVGSLSALHGWLNRHYPKAGACEKCGTVGDTDYAFLRHPEPHTRNRDDYAELCRRCHTVLDVDLGVRPEWSTEHHPAKREGS